MAILHIGHSWGGGLTRWMSDFMHADKEKSFLLTSRGSIQVYSQRFEILDNHGKVLTTLTPKKTIARAQLKSRELFAWATAFIRENKIETIIFSSPFGFSADLLDLPAAKKIVVLHDFSYVCAGTFGHFKKPCVRCEPKDLRTCISKNPGTFLYSGIRFDEFSKLRQRFVKKTADDLILVAPSNSTVRRIYQIEPQLLNHEIKIIGHGLQTRFTDCFGGARKSRKLRLLLTGAYLWHKGWFIAQKVLPDYADEIDFYAIGCAGPNWESLNKWCKFVQIEYKNKDLPKLLAQIKPDMGLLMSLVPETFSYSYSELGKARIPVIATRLGALAERFVPGTGFLIEPTEAGLRRQIEAIIQDRRLLTQAHAELKKQNFKTATRMVQEYKSLSR